MPKYKIFFLLTALVFLGVACGKKEEQNPVANNQVKPEEMTAPTENSTTSASAEATADKPSPSEEKTVILQTSLGDIKLEFYPADAPKTVANFIKLAEKGFYDGVTFHRVIPGFMIQGGDPLSKDADPTNDGTGGPGYMFEDELNSGAASYQTGYKKGVLAMANAGSNTNGSQFFIMLTDYPLPHNYTIFGRVIAGQEVVDKIGLVKTGDNDRPVENVVIKKVAIEK